MTTKGLPAHRPTVGRLMRVPGVAVDLVRIEVGETLAWKMIVAGETWIVSEITPRRWQGFTEDHLTGTPRLRHQSEVVRWILRNQQDWVAKLRVRREQGTRMVDPKP